MSLIDQILAHAHRVDQRANALADDLVGELSAVRERLLGKLAVVSESLKTDWQNTGLKRRKQILKRQQAQVENVLADVYGKRVPNLLLDAGEDVFEATVKASVKAGEAAWSIKAAAVQTLDKTAVKLWFESSTVDGLLINDWLAKLERAAADRIISASRQALIEGIGADSAARLLRRKGVEGSVPGLRGLARTTLMSALNYSQEQTFSEAFREVLVGWTRVGTLDRRSCLICGNDDGHFYPKGEGKPTLPQHWLCRCTYLPQTEKTLKAQAEAERPATYHEGRTVHHRDGSTSTKWTVESAEQVPGNLTYNKWLRGMLDKDPAFVRSILGKTRFKLYKSGKLSLNRMVTSGRIKRLSEIVK